MTEVDPGRRQTLATWDRLPEPLLSRLAVDPHEQVRAAIASRADLPGRLAAQLADPDREPSPIVMRSIAASIHAAHVAADLVGCGDPVALALLALNPDTPVEVLDRLTESPDADVATAAIGARAGLRPTVRPSPSAVTSVRRRRITSPPKEVNHRPEVVQEMHEAPAAPDPPRSDPLIESPGALAALSRSSPTSPPTPSPPMPPVDLPSAKAVTPAGTSSDYERAQTGSGQRRLVVLATGLSAIVGGLIAAALVLTLGRPTAPAQVDPQATASVRSNQTSPTGMTTTTTTSWAAAPTSRRPANTASEEHPAVAPPASDDPPTSVPTTTSSTPSGPAAPASPVVVPPIPHSSVSRTITVKSASDRFCGSVHLTVKFSPSPASVTITDDHDHELALWNGPSGQTRTVTLPSPSRTLTVTVAAAGTALSASSSAAGIAG